MRTTLEIDERLLRDIVKATGEKTKSKAVAKALEEYARIVSMDELRSLAGNIALVDNLDELEERELEEQERA